MSIPTLQEVNEVDSSAVDALVTLVESAAARHKMRGGNVPVEHNWRGRLMGKLKGLMADEERHLFTTIAFDIPDGSSNGLSQGQTMAWIQWLDDGGNKCTRRIVEAMLEAQRRRDGQLPLTAEAANDELLAMVEESLGAVASAVPTERKERTMAVQNQVPEPEQNEGALEMERPPTPPWNHYSEAPASLNFFAITKTGYHVQITLRDTDEKELWRRFVYLTSALQKAGVEPKAVGGGSNGGTNGGSRKVHPANVENGPAVPPPPTNLPQVTPPPTLPGVAPVAPTFPAAPAAAGPMYYDTQMIRVTAHKGKPRVEFWQPGRQYPEITWSLGGQKLLGLAPWMAQVGITAQHLDTPTLSDYMVPCRVFYEHSQKLNSRGNPYEDIVAVEPLNGN